jgi:hypothetical protein
MAFSDVEMTQRKCDGSLAFFLNRHRWLGHPGCMDSVAEGMLFGRVKSKRAEVIMTIRQQNWRFILVCLGVVIGLLLTPTRDVLLENALINYLSEAHYACIYVLMMFVGLWIVDFLRWCLSSQHSPTTLIDKVRRSQTYGPSFFKEGPSEG